MTGHTKESVFLTYIGKTEMDYLTQTANELQEPEQVNKPMLANY
jgi:hypothetical protein